MRERLSSDDGFSLVETVVAMVLFAIVAAISAVLLSNILGVVKGNTQRVAAANLAAKYVEEVRGQRAIDIVDGGTQFPPVMMDGTPYTVTRTANYVESGAVTSLCAGTGSNLVYKLVTITVTWPNMGSTKPVRSDTLKALGLGKDGLDATKGIAAVQLMNASGQPLPGVAVVLASRTVTTGVDGCALFTNLAPSSTYTATVNQPGHTGRTGDQLVTSSAPISVTAQQVTRASLIYDRAGSLGVSFSSAPGHVAPAGLGVTLTNTTIWSEPERSFADCSVVASNPKNCVSGVPRTATRLFPGTYGVWGGACAPKPTTVTTAVVTAGAPIGTTVPLAPLTVTVSDFEGNPVAGRTVWATARTTTSCAEKVSMTTDGGGAARMALPSGTWKISLTSDPTGAPEVPLDAYSGAPAPTLSFTA